MSMPKVTKLELQILEALWTLGRASIREIQEAFPPPRPAYTTSQTTADAYIAGIEAGLAHVNVHTGYKEPWLPFGGVKQSGAGLPENSETGLEFFVNRKAVYQRLSSGTKT